MSEQVFIDALRSGNIARVIEMLEAEPNLAFVHDDKGRNCLGTATAEGRWELAMLLLRQYKISPHKLDTSGESILHLYVRGVEVRPPMHSDFTTVRNENIAIWEREQDYELRRIEELKQTHPQNRPPMKMLVKRVRDLEKEMFGDLHMIFPKFIIEKYHVVVNRKNSDGKNPADLADELGFDELKVYFEFEMDTHRSRRKLLQGLNENLLREVASYL